MAKGLVEFDLRNHSFYIDKVLMRLGYIAAVSPKPSGPWDLLVLSKVERGRGRLMEIAAVKAPDRFRLNKYIYRRDIDVVTVIPGSAVPSKAQLRALAGQGKAVEVVIGDFIRLDPGGLIRVLDLMEDVKGLTLIFSQGVTDLRSVKNPMDILNYLDALTGRRRPWVDPLLRSPLDYLVDVMYRRGICF
ncbi:MAG: hypothetical protein ACP5NY_08005 [Thermocladium sp.]